MTLHEYEAKLEVLRQITAALTLPDSEGKTKLLEALWALHDITPDSGGGPADR